MPVPAQSKQSLVQLIPEGIMGFSGQVRNGYVCHPGGAHVIYPVGCEVVIKDLSTKKQNILLGHSKPVTCVAVSPSGKYIATGEETTGTFKADLILWDFKEQKILHRFSMHKRKVESVVFSPDERYIVSLGGKDDNGLILWSIDKGAAISGATASRDSSGATTCISYCRKNPHRFCTGGDNVIRVWNIDTKTMKMQPTDCQLGQIKRVVNCLSVDFNDELMYCGTTTGDVLQININTGLFVQSGPSKTKDFLHGGVTSVKVYLSKGVVYVGSGTGTVGKMSIDSMSVLKKKQVRGSVTSLALHENQIYVATSVCDIYRFNNQTLEGELQASNHDSCINAVCFPAAASDIFVTASDKDVRVWNLNTRRELMRIQEQGLSCKSILVKRDGSSIITGWTDGKVRAYGPQTGQVQYVIHDVHKGAVTALAATKTRSGQFHLVTGGEDGQVRMWSVSKQLQKMVLALKEHKGTVTEIRLRNNENECISSCTDGSCILWDLNRGVRHQILFGTTAFKSVKYFPDESQLLTCGSDGKISYWETFDGNLIRNIETTPPSSLNSLEITQDGQYVLVGGSDKKVKLYKYEEGTMEAIGKGHSSDINQIVLSPNQKKLVSVGIDGAIFIWTLPVGVGAAMQPLA